MTWKEAVLRLQEIDLDLNSSRKRLKEIQEALDDDARLQAARARAKREEHLAAQARKAQRDLEFEMGRVDVTRQQKENQLYSGRVRNARELQDLEAQVKSLKQRKRQLEDELLEAMVTYEEAAEVSASASDALAKVQHEWDAHVAALTGEAQLLTANVARLEEEAGLMRQEIPDAILDSYDYLVPRTGGIPVARVKDEICGMCGIRITSSRLQSALAGRETYCDGCGRLLIA
ncbi:MAG: hypothetical protein JXB35_14130 [Anaerolineae bacterium]|nr:hypothetical protein [Anaerolineae bacterium]